MRLNRSLGMVVVQAPEPGDGGGGGSGAPAPEPKASPEAKPEPKPEAKPEPKPEPEAKPEPKPEAKPEPEKPKGKGKAREVIASLEQRVSELSQTHEADRKAIVDERWDIALERAGVLPEYRSWARTKIGEVDLKTDEGKGKVDDFVRGHVAMTTRAKAASADPVSAWVDKAKGDAAKAPTSALANMPRNFLADYARNAVSEPGS